ncbi:XTP/dITP diphosphohydrolase [Tenacibaculum lutimaris]|uniref:dITP/XTP pyrophosphatase n=2 Tax=Tenacibaculum lutimaris TaxID=285258 RepID=A0A420DZ10_9FLAO|nr:XTP/dITP diphosphohydrolase [Tenacibaculum lutimaris]
MNTFALVNYQYMKLVFATNNLNKLAEVQKMLPTTIELLSLKDINCFDDIEETATTLEGNAQIKANHISEKYGYNCFADDTGLEVSALNGAPGVYSARYAGEPTNAENNMQKLLQELDNQTNRDAQFKTSICLNLNGEQFLFDGVCKGTILTSKQGEKGFGYDPIFQPEGYNKSFAEMTAEEKNNISHRGLAIQQLVSFLKSIN